MNAKEYLDFLNREYFKLHKDYEDVFWLAYMGKNELNPEKDKAAAKRDAFRADSVHMETLSHFAKATRDKKIKERIKGWMKLFDCYQIPASLQKLKQKIDVLESKIQNKRGTRKEGYIDPYTKKFVEASENKMSTIMVTHDDEKMRKAMFVAREKIAATLIPEYIQLIKLRNEYAKSLGYEDFYAMKANKEEGMSKKEIFSLFNTIYNKTKYAYADIRKLEKTMPGLRKPWNYGYMMAGEFTKEEDPYFQFDTAIERWGRSFMALGVDFKEGELSLDLLDRKGKYNNGFCHWPKMVSYEGTKRIPGSSNFTCNVVAGEIGEGYDGFHTLFHEGGHAAHLLNSTMRDVWANQEYAPTSTAWAETQSMFMDTMFSSIEWKSRYAKDGKGNPYPMDLYKRMVEKLYITRPLAITGIIAVSNFEKEIYEAKNLTKKKAQEIAKKNYKKYFDYSEESARLLNVPHIYSWESSGSYHGYGLATLAFNQWRAYFFDKYGYIVDNPKVGKELEIIWKLGGAPTFKDAVVLATKKKLSAQAFLENVTASKEKIFATAAARIKRLSKVPFSNKPIDLKAKVSLLHGEKKIADNNKSFEDMALTYKNWLKKQK